MKRAILLLILGIAITGCSTKNSRVTFDDQIFRGSAKADDRKARDVFTATVRDVEKSPEGAREAVRYEGTKYCIRWFGSSEIEWEIDPQSESLSIVEGELTLRGRCVD